MMKKLLFTIAIFFVLMGTGIIQAQSYRFTLGLRFSDGYSRMLGLTAQNRLAKKLTLESIIQSDFRNNHTGHVLLERHHNLVTRRINYYYGAGVSFGQEKSFTKNMDTGEKEFTYDNNTIGADVIFGFELTMLHLNVSWDVKPNFNLIGRENWITFQTGISVRSVILKNKKKKKKKSGGLNLGNIFKS